jgi:NAD(P)-dependent dehydrogenase (short-subunit alcohol dehydrogenase family)
LLAGKRAIITGAGSGIGRATARVRAREGAQTTSAHETTPGSVVALVREGLGLGAGVPVAGGTDMYFCELNRTRPEVDDRLAGCHPR